MFVDNFSIILLITNSIDIILSIIIIIEVHEIKNKMMINYYYSTYFLCVNYYSVLFFGRVLQLIKFLTVLNWVETIIKVIMIESGVHHGRDRRLTVAACTVEVEKVTTFPRWVSYPLTTKTPPYPFTSPYSTLLLAAFREATRKLDGKYSRKIFILRSAEDMYTQHTAVEMCDHRWWVEDM